VNGQTGGGTLGFLAAALASSVLLGLAVITATVLLEETMRAGPHPDYLHSRLYLLFGGTLAGVLIAAWAAWRLLAPIESAYRRGSLAMVSGFATVLLMLVCIPIHQLLGQTGLIILLALSGIVAALLGRRASRLGANA
jgi:hypothetical protein